MLQSLPSRVHFEANRLEIAGNLDIAFGALSYLEVQRLRSIRVNHNGTRDPRTSDNFASKVSQLQLIAAAPFAE